MSVAPPGAPPAPGTVACPRCGASIGPEQSWCLECGAPARTRLVPTPNWRAPVAVLALVVLLAGIALAVAFVALTNDNEPAAPVNSQAPPPSATTAQPPAAAQPAPTTGRARPDHRGPRHRHHRDRHDRHGPEHLHRPGTATEHRTGQSTSTGATTSTGEGGTTTSKPPG